MLRRTATTVGLTAALVALGGPALACPPPAKADRLVITYQEGGMSAAERFVLECHPVGGDHPQAREACAAVERATQGRAPSVWEPVDENQMCTQIYGGPQTARITGEWGGREVDARFSRENGCEIHRWDRLTPALPAVA
ncbi:MULTISPECIES: SSI family serine proteinase inhibitor [Streptomyces]|uniref:SSI family serine proteinase inhibitor n=1 Tax=Streptomyces TaxID=1883 RepID=UPI002249485B|nr:SSI family serine proteinase inhibitor [Streptomyces sp. JHD 1]MCX2967868.1 SSI family serine proteinase inhibitor [Streptomyces sp. JHD 1]